MKTCSNDGPKVRGIRRAAMVLCGVASGLFGGPSALADLPQNEDAQAFIELLTLASPGVVDEVSALAAPETAFMPGETFYLEVWAQTTDVDGLASVYLDIEYDSAVVSAVDITHTDLFDLLTSGAIESGIGRVDDVGGSHLAASGCDDQVGASPKWGRVVVIEMTVDAVGTTVIQSADTGSLVLGISICDIFGDLDPATVEFGQVTLTIKECFEDTDCDDDVECTDDLCILDVCEYPPFGVGTPCGNQTPQGICDNPDVCDGAGTCVPNYEPGTTECRPVAGGCDIAESCTGTSADCPDDDVEPDTTECRPVAGDCDVAEFCDGTSVDCPTDGFLPDTAECRPAVDICDVAEFCTVYSAACPADAVEPDTTECRPVTGICDISESCTGDSSACPADEFSPGTTVCRPSGDPCDPPESCDGVSANCPTNVTMTDCIDDDDCCPPECDFSNDNDCRGIPTLSEWGVAVIVLLLLVTGKIYFGRRCQHAT